MLNAFWLYLRYIAISFRSQMQYRVSFVMLSAGHLLLTGIDFLSVWVLFHRFGRIQGWALPEIALLYGLVNVAFAIAEATSRGFDTFANLVRSGEFDRVLLRPRSTALQVAGQELQLRRVGRFLQGFTVLLWATSALDLPWTPIRMSLTVGAVLGGGVSFTDSSSCRRQWPSGRPRHWKL